VPVKILIPVLPTERFYEAVVAAADLLTEKGGTVTFLFAAEESLLDPETMPDSDDLGVEPWQNEKVQALDDARDLLFERGIGAENINYVFADFGESPAQAIADEAAAGSYDYVVMSKGEFHELPDMPGQAPEDIAVAVQALHDDGVRLLVT
jgi:nucleotide-binding universal stress UspA family protein